MGVIRLRSGSSQLASSDGREFIVRHGRELVVLEDWGIGLSKGVQETLSHLSVGLLPVFLGDLSLVSSVDVAASIGGCPVHEEGVNISLVGGHKLLVREGVMG